ncbi:hypothetical protein [Actinoplanes sp. NPDC049118]|uniref:hypothetical protein n=1 Tax=Actinoplanes sp. NPDC049118 TaxID=3155769 RepID=UPI0033C194AA
MAASASPTTYASMPARSSAGQVTMDEVVTVNVAGPPPGGRPVSTARITPE